MYRMARGGMWWYYRGKIKGEKLLNDYVKGFISGVIMMLLTAIFISCNISPLEAYASEIGSNAYNPLYVKIVD